MNVWNSKLANTFVLPTVPENKTLDFTQYPVFTAKPAEQAQVKPVPPAAGGTHTAAVSPAPAHVVLPMQPSMSTQLPVPGDNHLPASQYASETVPVLPEAPLQASLSDEQ